MDSTLVCGTFTIKGYTGRKYLDGSKVYIFECPYCHNDFESTRMALKPKTGRKIGKDHCGCQTHSRMGNRSGKPPSNKLEDIPATVNCVRNSYKAASKTKGREFLLTTEEVEELIFNNCFYCGIEPKSVKTLGAGVWKRNSLPTNGIDRLDSSKGYMQGNVVSCCAECNYFKSDISFDDFCLKVHTISTRLKGMGFDK